MVKYKFYHIFFIIVTKIEFAKSLYVKVLLYSMVTCRWCKKDPECACITCRSLVCMTCSTEIDYRHAEFNKPGDRICKKCTNN